MGGTVTKVRAVKKSKDRACPKIPPCAPLILRSDDEEDETAELMRELEKIKRERAEQKAKEVSIFSLPLPS